MFRPQFEVTVPLSREECFNRLQQGLDFSLINAFSIGRRPFRIQGQQVAFDRQNINRIRFELKGQFSQRLFIIIELNFVDMNTTRITGEVNFSGYLRLSSVWLKSKLFGGNPDKNNIFAKLIIYSLQKHTF